MAHPSQPYLLIVIILLLSACQPAESSSAALPTIRATAARPTPPWPIPTVATKTPLPPPVTLTPSPTNTETPTQLPSATPSQTPSPSPTLTATPIPMCDERILPPDDLLALVDRTYGLSPDYEPADLVPLADHVPIEITLGYDTQIRQIIAEPLAQMVADMRAAGLDPSIISGYRSYAAQRVAWNKWLINQPEYGAQLSAEPGHSEHQLGTTVDFGSPELPGIVGEENIQFHTYFYQTSEGIWLLANASEYGFSLSYPREAYDVTGFFYEPWHYRYLGVEMATHLKNVELSLAEWHMLQGTVPCVPNEGS